MLFKKDKATEYQEGYNNNLDPYGHAVYTFAERWAELMEREILKSDNPAAVIDAKAESLSHEADDADAPRILTLDELRALPIGAVVWYEQRALTRTYIMPMVVTADGHIGCWALGVCMDVIGQDDRCWSARPTDAQREATPWRV